MTRFLKYVFIGLLLGFWYGIITTACAEGLGSLLLPASTLAHWITPLNSSIREQRIITFVCCSMQVFVFFALVIWAITVICESMVGKNEKSDN